MNKPVLILTTGKPLSSKHVLHTNLDIFESLYAQFKDEYEVIFLSKFSEKNRIISLLNKHNRDAFFDDIILVSDVLNDNFEDYDNWRGYYDSINLENLPKVSKIIEVGSGVSAGTKLQDGQVNYEQFFDKYGQWNYISVRNIRTFICLMTKISIENNIELEHYIRDPQEFNYNDIRSGFEGLTVKRYFQYNSPLRDFKRNDAFLDYYKQFLNKEFKKTHKLTFGYSVQTEDRISQDIISIENKYNILVKDKYRKIDTFVDRDEYLNLISKSTFTLIMPAYDIETFSIFRYIESIALGCIPLILDNNYLDEVKKDFYIPDILLVDSNNLKDSIRSKIDHIESLGVEKVITDLKKSLM